MTRRNTPLVSFIGFGEAGQAMAAGLREAGVERIAAWDILFAQTGGAPLKAAGEKSGVRLAASACGPAINSGVRWRAGWIAATTATSM